LLSSEPIPAEEVLVCDDQEFTRFVLVQMLNELSIESDHVNEVSKLFSALADRITTTKKGMYRMIIINDS
jgi:hypothetical protein